MDSIASIRRRLKRRRRNLAPTQRRHMNDALCRHILSSHRYRNAQRIAAYLPFGGEPDLTPVIRAACKAGKHCYLPRIDTLSHRLRFHRWMPGQTLENNQFSIPEPNPQAAECDVFYLDLLLTPLLGFDRHGNRMGMGAGFYDRTFAFRRHRTIWQRPALVGTAWSCQEVDILPVRSWDIPVDALVVEQGWIQLPPYSN